MSASPPAQNAFQRMMQASKQLASAKKQRLAATPAAALAISASPPAALLVSPTLGSSQEPYSDQPASQAGAAAAVEAALTAGEAAGTAPTIQPQAVSEDAADLGTGLCSQESGLDVGEPQQPQQQQHAAAVAAFKSMFGSSQRPPAQQTFTHLLVYDFEATCNKQRCA
jgi:phage-related tail protein